MAEGGTVLELYDNAPAEERARRDSETLKLLNGVVDALDLSVTHVCFDVKPGERTILDIADEVAEEMEACGFGARSMRTYYKHVRRILRGEETADQALEEDYSPDQEEWKDDDEEEEDEEPEEEDERPSPAKRSKRSTKK